jgi:hypothetical protein
MSNPQRLENKCFFLMEGLLASLTTPTARNRVTFIQGYPSPRRVVFTTD